MSNYDHLKLGRARTIYMLVLQGALDKMQTHYSSEVDSTSHSNINYTLTLYNQSRSDSQSCIVNHHIGHRFTFTYENIMSCKNCYKVMSKSYFQGLCAKCYFNSVYGAPCILRPELCTAHIDTLDSRCDPDYHNRHHCVYLVHGSKIKVGVTNCATLPTRWIDQGATRAIVLAYTPHRALAGEIEVALKAHYSDRQSWQRMLKGEMLADVDLKAEKLKARSCLPDYLQSYCISDDDEDADQWSQNVTEIYYPLSQNPTKVKSTNFDKVPVISGVLQGIKGQYLIFKEGFVLNIRSYSSYHVHCLIEEKF